MSASEIVNKVKIWSQRKNSIGLSVKRRQEFHADLNASKLSCTLIIL